MLLTHAGEIRGFCSYYLWQYQCFNCIHLAKRCKHAGRHLKINKYGQYFILLWKRIETFCSVQKIKDGYVFTPSSDIYVSSDA